MNNYDSLSNKVAGGAVWCLVDAVAKKGLVLLIQILLARLVLPEAFGLFGMLTVFITISDTIADCGMTNALIRELNTTNGEYSFVFFLNLLISVLLYVILCVSSGAISDYYNSTELKTLIPLVGLNIVFYSLSAVQRAIVIKKMLFKQQAIASAVSVVIAGAVSVACASIGMQVYALVINSVASQLFEVIALYFLVHWRPSLSVDFSSFKKYFSFGWRVLLASIISSIFDSVFSLVIGKKYSKAELGYYTNATKISNTASSIVTQVSQKVSFPVMSQLQDDAIMLKKSYSRLLCISALISFPIMFGIIAISNVFVSVVLGGAWIFSIPYLKMTCIVSIFTPIHRLNLNVLYVKGRADLVLKIELIKKGIGVCIIILFVLVTKSVLTLLIGSIIYELIALLINTYYTNKLIGYSIIEQIKDIFPYLIISSIMGIAVYYLGFNLPLNGWVVLMLQILFGVLIYSLLVFAAKKEDFEYIKHAVRRFTCK